jgi:NPCBM/NEW2 domain
MPSGTPVAGSIFFPGRAKMRRRIKGNRRIDFDAVECLCFFLPFVPRRPVHVWNWGRDASTGHAFSARRETYYSYRSMPIRWAPDLLVRALLRYWLWVLIPIGLLFSVSLAHSAAFKVAGLILFLVSLVGWIALVFLDGGQKNIRRLLGRHRLGVSDPATWTDDLLHVIAPPREWFGTETFAEAVGPLLKQRRYSEAMWAARLCLAIEDQREGRLLTDDVLGHPDVPDVLARIQDHPKRFKELVNLEHPQPFPLLRQEKSKAAAYWHSMVADQTREVYTMVTYAGHIGGVWAWGEDAAAEETESGSTRDDPHPLANQLGPETSMYRWGGSGLVVAVLLLAISFVSLSSQFGEKTPAQKSFEDQQRQAAEEKKKKAGRNWADDREAGNWQYLADLPEFGVKEGPWKFAKDGTMGNPERSPIKVGGFPSPKGLAMLPNNHDFAAVKYRLDKKARTFKSVGAINDTAMIPNSPLVFEVWGDGKLLWQSERVTGKEQYRECRINVEDVEVLELRTVCLGFNGELHAVWLQPDVLMK